MNGTTPEFPVAAQLRGFVAAHQADVTAADDGVREWIHPDSPDAPLISEIIGWYAGIDLWALYDRSRIIRFLGEEPGPYDQIFTGGALAAARQSWSGEGGDAFFDYVGGDGGGGAFQGFVDAVRSKAVDHYRALSSPDGTFGVIGKLQTAMTTFKETLDVNIPGFAQARQAAADADTPEGPIRRLLYIYNANINQAQNIGFTGSDVLLHNVSAGWGQLVAIDTSQLGATATDGTRPAIDGGWSPG